WRWPKLVFRDISKKPIFWIDFTGSVVAGGCYWIAGTSPAQVNLLWLAVAVANSTLIERFYDYRFNNKLYGGRRRFVTQYVEQFPLPDPQRPLSQEIIALSKRRFACTQAREAQRLEAMLNRRVWRAFGLPIEEAVG